MTGQRTGTGDLAAALEALLFVADRPLATRDLADLAEAPAETVTEALGTLADTLEGRGIRLQQLGDAWQLTTAPEVADRVRRYAERTEGRLSPAAVEALAVVAYRQPATRGDVERVRGVDSESVMRSLLHRRLITEAGRRDSPGRPILYRTTFTFLERFGMESLEELPELDVDPDPGPASAIVSAERDEVDEAAEREVAADRHAG